ncbi:J domain-containing protein [Pararobbsia alpina]|uniref:J domain-containing protein n=1 Tax=Pararobbsia alpina TaxID=621374 RepID=UPI0039A652F8
MENYYDILSIREDASTNEVKLAYRYAAAKVHPAHGNALPDSFRRFSQLAEAYSVLADETARGVYDVRRHPAGRTRSYHPSPVVAEAEFVFISSMVEWVLELRTQGYAADPIRSILVSHQCPGSIADSVCALADKTLLPSVNQSTRTLGQGAPATGQGGYSTGYAAGKAVGGQGKALLLVAVAAIAFFVMLQHFSEKQQSSSAIPAPTVTSSAGSDASAVVASAPAAETPSGPQPYAFLKDIPELQSVDTVRGVALRPGNSFHLPTGVSVPASQSGSFNTTVAQRIPLPFGSRVLYLLTSVPVESQAYDCHACAPVVSVAVTTVSKRGVEALAGPIQDVDQMGAWGKYDTTNVALVEIGKRRVGLVFPFEYTGQGETSGSISIFSVDSASIRKLANIATYEDATASMSCDGSNAVCENYRTKVRFVRDNKSAYYPLELKITGKIKNKTGLIVPVDGTFVAKFNGTGYALDTDESAAHPTEDSPASSPQPPGGAS